MSERPFEMPHEPAPPEPRRIVPEGPLLVRGVALAGLAVGAGWLGLATAQRWLWLAPVGMVGGVVAVLSAWASVIHLTGGEKFDDHPWV